MNKVFTGLHALRLFVTVLPRSFLLVLPQKIAAHFTPCESFRGKHTARSLYAGGVTVCDIVTPRPRTWDLRDLVFLIWFSFEACCSTRELTKHLPQVSQFELCLPCWKSPASHSVQQAILVAGDNRVLCKACQLTCLKSLKSLKWILCTCRLKTVPALVGIHNIETKIDMCVHSVHIIYPYIIIYVCTAIDCCLCISTHHIVYIVGVSFEVPLHFHATLCSIARTVLGEKGC